MFTEFHWFWGLVLVWSAGFVAFWAWRWTEGKLPTWQLWYLTVQFVVIVLMTVFATSPALWPDGT